VSVGPLWSHFLDFCWRLPPEAILYEFELFNVQGDNFEARDLELGID
jgi:hypothetical protein